MFVHYVDLEREAATKSKKGVGDLEVGKVLRLIIRTADNEQRAGIRQVLECEDPSFSNRCTMLRRGRCWLCECHTEKSFLLSDVKMS